MNMIHSMAGGTLQEKVFFDGAKVEFLQSNYAQIGWYINPFPNLKEGDIVLVPVGREQNLVEARVVKIEKHISSQVSPVPYKRMKKITQIVKG